MCVSVIYHRSSICVVYTRTEVTSCWMHYKIKLFWTVFRIVLWIKNTEYSSVLTTLVALQCSTRLCPDTMAVCLNYIVFGLVVLFWRRGSTMFYFEMHLTGSYFSSSINHTEWASVHTLCTLFYVFQVGYCWTMNTMWTVLCLFVNDNISFLVVYLNM